MVVDSVSVIVPHFNRPDLVRGALLSIHRQSIQPAEILLVDDGSSPENQDKLRELSSLATIVTSPRNGGFSAGSQPGRADCQRRMALLPRR